MKDFGEATESSETLKTHGQRNVDLVIVIYDLLDVGPKVLCIRALLPPSGSQRYM